MKDGKYEVADLRFTTVAESSIDQLCKMVAHVATLIPEKDDEEPVSYLGWIFQHGLGFSESGAIELAKELLSGCSRSGTAASEPSQYAVLRLRVQSLRRMKPKKRPDNYLPPHQIYLVFDAKTGELVDIAGFVPDDRDVGKKQGLAQKDPSWIGFFGGHNVRRDKRGQGIGPLMIVHRVQKIQEFVDKIWRKPASVYTFLINEISGKLLVNKGGFKYLGVWHIDFYNKDEHVFRREFVPSQFPAA